MDIAPRSVREPAPPLPVGDQVDRCPGHAVTAREVVGTGASGLRATDGTHVIVLKLAGSVTCSAWPNTVQQHVCSILRSRRPSQVSRVYTSEMAFTAAMGGLVAWRRRGAVREFAHEVRSNPLSTIDSDDAVSPRSAKRPYQTLFAGMAGVRVQPLSRGPRRCTSSRWTAVAPLSRVMRRAQLESVVGFLATRDGALQADLVRASFHRSEYSGIEGRC